MTDDIAAAVARAACDACAQPDRQVPCGAMCDCYHYGARILAALTAADLAVVPAAAVAEAVEDEARNPWLAAVVNAMLLLDMLPEEGETPRDALNRLICVEQRIALDPSVSNDAQALYQRGQRDMRERAAAAAAEISTALPQKQWQDDEVIASWGRCLDAIRALPLTGETGNG